MVASGMNQQTNQGVHCTGVYGHDYEGDIWVWRMTTVATVKALE